MAVKKIITILCIAISFSAQSRPKFTDKEPSVWLYNQTLDQVIFERNSHEIRPFASITKLMTAMLVIDQDWNFDRRLPLSKLAGSKLPRGYYSRGELLDALLIHSDNAAAETFAADYPGGRTAFIQAMNQRAWQLGMYSTEFQDPSGLSAGNISNAKDIGTLVQSAGQYPLISNITLQRYALVTAPGRRGSRMVQLSNTNGRTLGTIDHIQLGKTGFTNPAGFCMALQVEQQDHTYVVIVLGAKNPTKRLDLVKSLLYNHTAEVGDGSHSSTNRKSKRRKTKSHAGLDQ